MGGVGWTGRGGGWVGGVSRGGVRGWGGGWGGVRGLERYCFVLMFVLAVMRSGQVLH